MFRTAFRTTVRRAFHSSAARSRPVTSAGRVTLVLGATAATVGVLTWNSRPIALDAAEPKTKKPLKPKATTTPEAEPASEPAPIHDEPSTQKGSFDASSSSPPSDEPQTPSEPPTTEEGEHSGASGGAFNPETGEINWDCPCLGGMAHGPCGMQFREAFSCFVFSEDEPKGINCVEKFKAMQDCFREHPDVYGDDIMDDDDDEPMSPPSVEEPSGERIHDTPISTDPHTTPAHASHRPSDETTAA
ncbi:hypothetical protein QCA50_009642 [Cerrena zonata]|uniref:Mitochondrial intermembrane space import and assembly protein 40 n=1 Tax=Cerrena zonata TaxID=2478898 RepID=A0AAW0G6S4_9APHY